VEIALVPVNIKDAAQRAIAGLGPSEGTINVELDPKLHVLAHEPTLVQCLANLVGNALKFHRPDSTPTVRIAAEQLSESVCISVEDNGIGIEPQYSDKIFKVFERLHGADEYPGTGIGLAIVKRGVERMN
jgi:signal transduction histidine kinase